MAQVWRHCSPIATVLSALAAVIYAPAAGAQDLYDRPVLAIDAGMHSSILRSVSVDRRGEFAVTGSSDRTVKIWSAADGKFLRTIWIPVGPEKVGDVLAVAISPDGSIVAAGGWTESLWGSTAIYLFDRESGAMIHRIRDLLATVFSLTFSPNGRYLAATLYETGLQVFDRDVHWREVFRDNYDGSSYGASFTLDGHLATTSYSSGGTIRLYEPHDSSFRLAAGPVKAPSGKRPEGVAFSPDGKMLAIGYHDAAAVDILDGASLGQRPSPRPSGLEIAVFGLAEVAWSSDGQELLAAGGVSDNGKLVFLTWNQKGLGNERRSRYCSDGYVISGLATLPSGATLVASMAPCMQLINPDTRVAWTVASPVADFRDLRDTMKVSNDGRIVDFSSADTNRVQLRFDVGSLRLSDAAQDDKLTVAPNRKGLDVSGWRDSGSPELDGKPIPMRRNDRSQSVAVAKDAKRFFLGSAFGVAAYDDTGAPKWLRLSRSEVWGVNASRDGRILVEARVDGTIRWHRAEDGQELLALQILPNGQEPTKWDWVLWTPEGFYEATPGAQNVLKWVVNHGPDRAATTLPVSAIAKLHRPNALPLVLNELETARALGVDDMTQARLDVQAKTGSEKSPGGVLHVLAIGVDKFGDEAGGLRLDYAVEDAHDIATTLLESQRGAPDKASLYADVNVTYLTNEQAGKTAIEDALDDMAQSMERNELGEDVAVIFISSHGEMIDHQYYLIPYGFVARGSRNAAIDSAISASEFAKKVEALAVHGKVLLLLDTCHSGAVGAGGGATDPESKVLQDAVDLENVTVLTSSKKNELSQELPEWKHGALAQSFLDALVGAADSQGIVRLSALTEAMENDVQSLTKERQHLGMHVNFSGDLFVASHQ